MVIARGLLLLLVCGQACFFIGAKAEQDAKKWEKAIKEAINLDIGRPVLHHVLETNGLDVNFCFQERRYDIYPNTLVCKPILLYAVEGNKIQSVKYLLEEGAYIDISEVEQSLEENGEIQKRSFPLLKAAESCDRHPEMAELLVNKGANINMRNSTGFSALQTAFAKILDGTGDTNGNCKATAMLLLGKGADPIVNTDYQTYVECKKKLKDYIEKPQGDDSRTHLDDLLGKCGWDVNFSFQENSGGKLVYKPLLVFAVEKNNKEFVDDMLGRLRADINIGEVGQLDSGEIQKLSFPLIKAVESGHLEILGRLLAWNTVNVNMKNNNGESPLHKAVELGNVEMATQLLNNGADVNMENDIGKSPLDKAVKLGNKEMAKLLVVDWYANVNGKNAAGESPLINAMNSVTSGDISMVKLLVDNRAPWIPLIMENGDSFTSVLKSPGNAQIDNLLRWACDMNKNPYGRSLDMTEKIIENNASCEKLMSSILLYEGVRLGLPEEKVDLLIKKGANISMTYDDQLSCSRSPLSVAICLSIEYNCNDGREDMVNNLLDKGTDPNVALADGDILLSMMAEHVRTEWFSKENEAEEKANYDQHPEWRDSSDFDAKLKEHVRCSANLTERLLAHGAVPTTACDEGGLDKLVSPWTNNTIENQVKNMIQKKCNESP